MSLTIILPDPLAEQLQRKAETSHHSVEEIALEILQNALEWEGAPTLEEVVDKIKRLPPNPANIRPAKGSFADALRNSPHDPKFDLDEWEQNWALFEAELKATAIANDIREGRR
jgi:plasmid stability protein